MDSDDIMEEKKRNLFSECLKLKMELFKILLTFASIAIGIEVFIISNSSFDVSLFGFNLKIYGLLAVFVFIICMAYYIYKRMNEVDKYYNEI